MQNIIHTVCSLFSLLAKPCGFPEIKHGRLLHADTSKSHFPVYAGRSLAYFCNYGYVPPSQASLGVMTCTQDGWSPEIPCLRKCSFKSLIHGYSPVTEERYVQGQSRTVMCHRGYGLPNPQNTMTCEENGWSPPPICIPVKQCDMPIFENARAYSPENHFDSMTRWTTNAWMATKTEMEAPRLHESADKCGPPPEISNGDITSFPLKAYSSVVKSGNTNARPTMNSGVLQV
ncbi:hypothetical protein QTO34_012388 [Cnephaeus nilssonii]|uniref:Sushi domain-containing protein n=1 Tax=Cnephaeus nilssonii TaxID=3371016 RepID=A0AA40HC70_CNENI|nr:hypothetical protein QTO34_012388 [Eptesicus nilssonii]